MIMHSQIILNWRGLAGEPPAATPPDSACATLAASQKPSPRASHRAQASITAHHAVASGQQTASAVGKRASGIPGAHQSAIRHTPSTSRPVSPEAHKRSSRPATAAKTGRRAPNVAPGARAAVKTPTSQHQSPAIAERPRAIAHGCSAGAHPAPSRPSMAVPAQQVQQQQQATEVSVLRHQHRLGARASYLSATAASKARAKPASRPATLSAKATHNVHPQRPGSAQLNRPPAATAAPPQPRAPSPSQSQLQLHSPSKSPGTASRLVKPRLRGQRLGDRWAAHVAAQRDVHSRSPPKGRAQGRARQAQSPGSASGRPGAYAPYSQRAGTSGAATRRHVAASLAAHTIHRQASGLTAKGRCATLQLRKLHMPGPHVCLVSAS